MNWARRPPKACPRPCTSGLRGGAALIQGNLDGIRLLAPLSPAHRSALAARCAWRRFKPGEVVLSREADNRDVLFLVSGRVRVVNYAASGREIAYAMVEPGAHVGELAALDGGPRSASVEAIDACLIAFLPSGPFHELLLAHPQLAVAHAQEPRPDHPADRRADHRAQRAERHAADLPRAPSPGPPPAGRRRRHLAAADPGAAGRRRRHDPRDRGARAGAARQGRHRPAPGPRAADPPAGAARGTERARTARRSGSP